MKPNAVGSPIRIGLLGLILSGVALAMVAVASARQGQPPAAAPAGVSFQDGTEQMWLRTPAYEIVFSKTNGAIMGITDTLAAARLSLGSNHGCLWGSNFINGPYVGGCSYTPTAPNRFTYAWDQASATLSLTYTGDFTRGYWVDTVVRLTVPPTQTSSFDLRLTLNNHWNHELSTVRLPSELLFVASEATAGYGPFYLPGVRLTPGFFASRRTYSETYPSGRVFADYLALDVNDRHFAFYAVNPAGPIQPAALTLADAGGTPQQFFASHILHTATPHGGTYTSPRVRVSIGLSPQQSIEDYRVANGIAGYPSLAAKLGASLPIVAAAPLIKADAAQLNLSFTHPISDDWVGNLLRMPAPALLHPVAFQARGHDENYPDFLPPDAQWGTTDTFRNMIQAAQARGLLVMPYINPTWWDDESPTALTLPLGTVLSDTAVQDRNGTLVTEVFTDGRGVHFGYVVSPHMPFVQWRLDQLLRQWRETTPVSETVPVDLVLEDQIGSRRWLYDFNPAIPTPPTWPLAYGDGWLAHTDLYSAPHGRFKGLMTEDGWDRLARTELGFHGSLLAAARAFDYADDTWGAGNWEPYPLALWLLHDKVLLYQHDLAELTLLPPQPTPTQTIDDAKELLTWNLAFGTMLSYHWRRTGPGTDTLDDPWLDLVTALQRAVAARYAGAPLTGYGEHGSSGVMTNTRVTTSTFAMSPPFAGELLVVANWSTATPHPVDGHQVAPGGYYARTTDQSVVAGVFAGRFNGGPLTAGDHYLVVERTPQVVIVRQPIGADTGLIIDPPAVTPTPSVTSNICVWALRRDGQQLGIQHCQPVGTPQVPVNYQQRRNGAPVGAYRVALCPHTFADVPSSNPFYSFITWMRCGDYTAGYPCGGPGEPCNPANDPYFRWGTTVTRGQLLKMVVLAADWPLVTPTTPTFADVPPNHPFFAFTETGFSHGIISGYNASPPCPAGQIPCFLPYNNITRGQLSKVIALARGYVLPNPPTPSFADVPPSHSFYPFVEAVYANNIVSGYACGGPGEPCDPSNRPYFRWGAPATRGQVTKFVALAYGGP